MSVTWSDVLASEKEQPYFRELIDRVRVAREQGKVIYPPANDVFNAFRLTELGDIKVVILGQDPYHGIGQAHGLSFSVPEGIALPPSLKNIFKALQHDFPGYQPPRHGDLTAWAKQGVFLLNTVLTVEQGQAHSHAKWGWQAFTRNVMKRINHERQGVIFMLWGAHAQKQGELIDAARHHILTAVHPSPLSAHRGFLTCGHFKRANELLVQQGLSPIRW